MKSSFFKVWGLLALLYSGISSIHAQNTGAEILESNITNTDDILLMAAPRTLSEKVEGSPHITQDFKPATINTSKKTQLVRYNAALDVMEVLKDQDDIMLLSKEVNYNIALKDGSGKVYQNHIFKDDEETKIGYFIPVEIASKAIQLYKKEKIRFVKGKLAKSSLEQDVPSKFKRENDSHYLKNDGEMEKIPSSKKAFFQKFNKKELKKFIKKNSLSLKNEKDMITILNYYYTES